jgi:hypothetical protein
MFCGTVAVFYAVLFAWGFRALPREEWQFIAVLPRGKTSGRIYDGINLTYYGFFNALAQLVAIFFFLVLCVSAGISIAAAAVAVLLLLGISMPASRILALLIEKKPHTATVAGGFFAGVLFAPVAVWLAGIITGGEGKIPPAPLYAAMAIAYAFGEGTGRLGCLSFGCCYGRPFNENPRGLERLIRPLGTVFTGKTKKISYASGWEGVPVWPVQSATAVIHVLTGILATCAFFRGYYTASFVVTIVITQGWRVASEFLRGDYRGARGPLSVYQGLSLLTMIFVLAAALQLPIHPRRADLTLGLAAVVNLPFILLLQVWGVFVFLYTGKSKVTGSSVRFHVHRESI